MPIPPPPSLTPELDTCLLGIRHLLCADKGRTNPDTKIINLTLSINCSVPVFFQIFGLLLCSNISLADLDHCSFTQLKILNFTTGITNCQNCLRCPQGYEANPPCRSDTIQPHRVVQVCRICKPSYFKSSVDEFRCKPCIRCPPGKVYELKCNSTSNSKCSDMCEPGMFLGKDSTCYSCCKCQSGQNQTERQCGKVSQ